MHIRFHNGLGDACMGVYLFDLWRKKYPNFKIDCSSDKEWLWKSCGYQIAQNGVEFAFPEPAELMPADRSKPWRGNKTGSVMPGWESEEIEWEKIKSVKYDLLEFVSKEKKDSVDKIFYSLPRPIYLFHTRGRSWSNQKSLPPYIEKDIALNLIESGASVVLLGQDSQPDPVISPRLINVKYDIETLYYFIYKADLMIGIDSGPFHLARLTNTPRLGLFHGMYPWKYIIPSNLTTCLATRNNYSQFRRFEYNVIDSNLNGQFVKRACNSILRNKNFLLEELLNNLNQGLDKDNRVIDRKASLEYFLNCLGEGNKIFACGLRNKDYDVTQCLACWSRDNDGIVEIFEEEKVIHNSVCVLTGEKFVQKWTGNTLFNAFYIGTNFNNQFVNILLKCNLIYCENNNSAIINFLLNNNYKILFNGYDLVLTKGINNLLDSNLVVSYKKDNILRLI